MLMLKTFICQDESCAKDVFCILQAIQGQVLNFYICNVSDTSISIFLAMWRKVNVAFKANKQFHKAKSF